MRVYNRFVFVSGYFIYEDHQLELKVLSMITSLIIDTVYTLLWMEFDCIQILCLILFCLVHTEHNNGVNFPDDKSIAVSAPKALWITSYHFSFTSYTQRMSHN